MSGAFTFLAGRSLSPSWLAATVGAGATWKSYVARPTPHAEELRRNYEAVVFTQSERDAIARIDKQLLIAAIVEDWCPDVVVTLPIVARISALNPAFQLNILHRPDHADVANAFRNTANDRSNVPTYVLLDHGVVIDILFERAPAITALVTPIVDEIEAEVIGRLPGITRADWPAEDQARLRAVAGAIRQANSALERGGIVDWLVTAAG